MKYIFTRGGRDGTWKECSCSVFIHSDRTFEVFFDQITPEIGLNDNNFHSIRRLDGIAESIAVGHEGIHINGCFVNIEGKWHKDGLTFRFAP